MSGFAGVVWADAGTPDEQLLQRMAERLEFRGPDATQISTRPGAGFCFTLLRTGPAPQSPIQPCSLDGRVWLIGDIRLDGRTDLQRNLEQSGEVTSKDVTDEEIILRAFRQWGEDAFAKLVGDFSFALWDAESRQLLCIRDVMGLKPFFYAQDKNSFYFSNMLEVLRLAPGLSSQLDPQFIGDFLLQEWSSDPARTVYRDIRRVPPGHRIEYSNDKLHVSRYKSLAIEDPLYLKRPEEYVERFQVLLREAVRDRLPNGPSAIFLSGGLDSTSIAAVAQQITKNSALPNTLRAYTIDCRPLFKDEEANYASLVAQKLGIPIEILSAASFLPYQGWDDSSFGTPEPGHEPFLLLSRMQYQQVRTHARVAFSGFGGDDILTGQAWPFLVDLLRHARFGTIARVFGDYMLKYERIPPLRGGFRARLKKWTGRNDVMAGYPQWLKPHFAEEYRLRERWLELRQPLGRPHPWHPIAYDDLCTRFWSNVFDNEDAEWTRVPIELRAPLLDHRILRFLLSVPPVPWCMEKELLRQAMRGLLPEEIRLRPKTPLMGDPLTLHVQNGKWSASPLPFPAKEIERFVDWERVGKNLAVGTGSTLRVDLRAVSLNHWLENAAKIG